MSALTVYTVGDLRYGMSEDREPLRIDIRDIHWLPPVSQHIAGITVVDEHTVSLIDLRACLGLPAMPRNCQQYLLLRTGRDSQALSAAFILPDTVGRSTVTPDAIIPLPEYLVSSVMKSYTVCDSRPVFIIDTVELFRQAQTVDFTPPRSNFAVSATAVSDGEGPGNYTLVDSADHSFAVPETCIVDSGACEAVAHPIHPAPHFITGINICDGRPIPLIDLAKRLNLETNRTCRLMLDVELDQQRFRFCIDALLPTIFSGEAKRRHLPALLQNNWRQEALIRNGDIFSILNLAGLLSGEPDSDAPDSAYTPQSDFSASFTREEVHIVEFEICGFRHALPGREVKPAIGMLPVSAVVNAKPLVAGVSEYDGELLPVLDLSRCFGRSAAPTATWSLIPVTNGDFKALILTERSFPPRRLSVDLHRDLPYENTENFVYGCYPDEVLVRLIFNVHALAVHFDRARHQDFFQILASVTQSDPEREQSSLLQQALFPEDADISSPGAFDAPELLQAGSTGSKAETSYHAQNIEPEGNEPQAAAPAENEASPQALLAKRLQKAVQFPAQASASDSDRDPAERQALLEKHERKEGGSRSQDIDSASEIKSPAVPIRPTDAGQDTDRMEQSVPAPGLGQEPEPKSVRGITAPLDRPERISKEEAGSDVGGRLESQTEPFSQSDIQSFFPAKEEQPLADNQTAGSQDEQTGDTIDEGNDPDAAAVEGSAGDADGDPDEMNGFRSDRTPDADQIAAESITAEDLRSQAGSAQEETSQRLFATDEGRSDVAGEIDREDFGDTAGTEPEDIPLEDPEQLEPATAGEIQAMVDELLPEEHEFIEAEVDPQLEDSPGDDGYADIEEVFAFSEGQSSDAIELEGGDFQDSVGPLPISSVPESRRDRKKVIALCLAALLLIVVSAAFTGWRLGWLNATEPIQSIRRLVSGSGSAAVPQKSNKPVPRASTPESQPPARPLGASPAADIQADKPPAVDDQTDGSEEEIRTIKIIDKDGRLVVYKVKKGDTLWGISEKYTGTGFNYPKLADDNRIKNPDLIFPRQRIEVK